MKISGIAQTRDIQWSPMHSKVVRIIEKMWNNAQTKQSHMLL